MRPGSVHDELLLARTGPSGHPNPAADGVYDLVVVGAGAGGLVSAAGAAGLGARVALVERSLLGGDCLVNGCVPSKALLAAAARAAAARGPCLGVRLTASVDFAAVMDGVRRARAALAEADAAERFRALGVHVFFGSGVFRSDRELTVEGPAGDRTLRFRRAIVATGGRPLLPPVPGLAAIEPLTADSVFDLDVLPDPLVVVGAGPVGCELGQAFARLGACVTLVEAALQVLPREEADAAAVVASSLEADGVTLRLGQRLERVEGRTLVLSDGTRLEGSHVLVALGRRASVEGLGLERAGVELEAGGVRVDATLRTTNRRIYAVGDVIGSAVVGGGRSTFTHSADATARVALQNALFPLRARATTLTVPGVTWTDPALARVGLTAGEAAARGVPVRTFEHPFSRVDRAVLDGRTEGFVRVHVRPDTDHIVGATIVGAHAGELIAQVVQAMVAGRGLRLLGASLQAYPAHGDALKRVGDAWSRGRLTPSLAGWMRWWVRRG